MAKPKKLNLLIRSKIAEDPETASSDRDLCQRCSLFKTTTRPFMRPAPTKEWNGAVAVVGEAAGADEEREGRYFVGRAGKLLRSECDRAGYSPRDVTFLNAVRCRPPGNATPSMEQIRCCRPFLLHELRSLNPKVILALGASAAKALFNSGDVSVLKTRGRPTSLEEVASDPLV